MSNPCDTFRGAGGLVRIGMLAAIVTLMLAACSRNDTGDPHGGDASHAGGPAHTDAHGHDHGGPETVTIADEALKANGVVIDRARAGTVTTEIALPGEVRLNADRVAHVVPRFPGVVLDVNKALGDRVHAGDVLAVIQSNLSAAPYDVTSLVDGVVVEKHVTLGEFVRDDADIFVVADLSTVWVTISVYSRYLSMVKTGQPVRITATGPGESANGVIDYVGPIVGEATRTGVARMKLANPAGRWQPGLFVTAHVAVSEAAVAVAVPDGAVQTVEGREVVFVRRGNRFEVRDVEIGRRGGDLIEIVSGLQAGEDYVAAGSFIFKAQHGKSEAGHDH